MVTTLKPNTKKTNFRYIELGNASVMKPEYKQVDVDKLLEEVFATPKTAEQANSSESSTSKSKSSFISGITRPLAAMFDLVSGPPMTMRERNRLEVSESYSRYVGSLNWFQQRPW